MARVVVVVVVVAVFAGVGVARIRIIFIIQHSFQTVAVTTLLANRSIFWLVVSKDDSTVVR